MLKTNHPKILHLSGVGLTLFFLGACDSKIELVEASGLVRIENQLVIVSDNEAGALFRYRLSDLDNHNDTGVVLKTISINPVDHQTFTSFNASDLESVDILPNGEIIVLSEQTNALYTKDGIAAQYPDKLAEIAGRGLEGLSVHSNGKIVVLWEGGYYSLLGMNNDINLPKKPRFCIHTLPKTTDILVCKENNAIKDLEVPAPPDSSQFFRAPDLVWDTDGASFIVLLASLNAANYSFRYLWLQRFSIEGRPSGAPINLCDKGMLPGQLRDGPESNIEGLAWFDPGNSLIMINDTNSMATAAVLSINPWPQTDNTIACDQ